MATAVQDGTREIVDIKAPEVGTWELDPAHTSIAFIARHMMVTKVRGNFGRFEGAIHVAEDPADSRAEAKIDAASLTTGDDQRDAHLNSGDFLLSEEHPHLTFRSKVIEHVAGDRWKVVGDLTVRGVTNEVTLDAAFEGTAQGMKGTTAFFSAQGEIDREDWGVSWNQALETGGVLVSKKVKIEIDGQVVKQEA